MEIPLQAFSVGMLGSLQQKEGILRMALSNSLADNVDVLLAVGILVVIPLQPSSQCCHTYRAQPLTWVLLTTCLSQTWMIAEV